MQQFGPRGHYVGGAMRLARRLDSCVSYQCPQTTGLLAGQLDVRQDY